MSETMIDRIATAMVGVGATDAWGCTDWNMLARAAIEAMREPTEAMIDACPEEGVSWSEHARGYARQYYQCMVDAALADGQQAPATNENGPG